MSVRLRAWSAMQYLVGGTVAKRELCVSHMGDATDVLEIGCATGNIAEAFRSLPVNYLGIDVDDDAITMASKRFASAPRMSFRTATTAGVRAEGFTFDLVLFAGVLHHIDDDTCASMLVDAVALTRPGGHVRVVEPVATEPGDPLLARIYTNADRGGRIRSSADLDRLILASSLDPVDKDERLIGATPFHRPLCARFVSWGFVPRG